MSNLNIIIKIKDKYCIWSKIKKRPETYLMDKEELFNYIEEKEGEDSEDSLPLRFLRVEEKGVSIKSLEKCFFINSNEAGQNNNFINEEDIYIEYSIGFNNKHLLLNSEKTNIVENNHPQIYIINKQWYISEKSSTIMLIISFVLVIFMYFIDKYNLDNRFNIASIAIFFYFIGILSSSKMKIWKKRIK